MPETGNETSHVLGDHEREMLEKLRDYELCLLYEERNEYQSHMYTKHLAYYYNRSIIRYMARLLFAIGWAKIRADVNMDENRLVYGTLFKNQGNKVGSIEPGTFAYTLKTCAHQAGKDQAVQEEVSLLFRLGKIRNKNAHEFTDVEFTDFYYQTDLALARFSELMLGKSCSYLMPKEDNGRGEVLCAMLKAGSKYADLIYRKLSMQLWSPIGNRLFYCVVDEASREVKYYSLSPFIEAPVFTEGLYPHFRIYERLKDNGYGSECDTLYYSTLIPKSVRKSEGEYGNGLATEFENTCERYRRADLFSSFGFSQNSLWNKALNNEVYINISSYPGFENVLRSNYKYCTAICPARQDVIDFCKDRIRQVAMVTGNGGVGKTALVLSILNEFLVNRAEGRFSNLIFVSAKKKYYEIESENYRLLDNHKADIYSYEDLILRLADLLGVTYSQGDTETAADAILRQMEQGASGNTQRKRFLLIIDDLDSLADTDQQKISAFIYKMDPRVFKTIVTTRDIADSSPVSYQVKELSEEASFLFAKWYTESVLEIASWDSWHQKKNAQKWIRDCGEGNPLTIQMLLVLVKAGLEETYQHNATQQERKEYLYNTVQNLLKKEEKLVFELCRQLYQALPEERADQDMLLSVPEYLAAGCGISKEIFEKSVQKLVQLKLISRHNNGIQFRTIFNNRITGDNAVELPAMYSLIWADVHEHPDPWMGINDMEGVIARFLISKEEEKTFDILTTRRIFERILAAPHMYEALKAIINDWMEKHSVSRGDSNLSENANRLIQSIEKNWDTFKRISDAGETDDSLIATLDNEIFSLRNLLKKVEDRGIAERLKEVRKEMGDYL